MDDGTYLWGPELDSDDSILIGRGTDIDRVPADHWRAHLAAAGERISARLAFMSRDHHLVRRFAVTEIAKLVRPVTETQISQRLKLPPARVHQVLGELESHLFFLARDSKGAVTWAYPFTSDETPHRVNRPSRPPARAA